MPWRLSRSARLLLAGVLTALLMVTFVQFVTVIGGLVMSHSNRSTSHINNMQQDVLELHKILTDIPPSHQEINQATPGLVPVKSGPPPSAPGSKQEPDVFTRADYVRDVCQARMAEMKGVTELNNSYNGIFYQRQRGFFYCPILKVSSTLLRRVFYSLDVYDTLKNPYSIPIMKALEAPLHNLKELLPFDQAHSRLFFSHANSFLMVREPLARLLSGYMDKLFAPNPFYWEKTGTVITAMFKPGPTRLERSCGQNVTFNEFVQYVVNGELDADSLDYRDPHFTAAYDQCQLCSLDYTMVGKLETFTRDTHAILNKLGIKVTMEDLAVWKDDVTLDAILDTVESPFGWRSDIEKCMSWYSGLRRVWRKLQSRAIIPLEEDFPFSQERVEKYLTAQEFINIAHSAHLRADKARLKRQKQEVLAMAYKTVSRSTLLKLLEVYEPDFLLFQYEIQPDFIFDKAFVEEVDNLSNIFDASKL